MSPMPENMEKFKQAFQKNLDRVLIAMLGLVLCAVGFLGFAEMNSPPGQPKQPPKSELEPKIKKEDSDPTYMGLFLMTFKGRPLIDSHFSIIARINPYDPNVVRNAEQLEEEANAILSEAKRLQDAGQIDEALEQVEEALRRLPSSRLAQQMREELNRLKNQPPPTEAEENPQGE